MFKAIKEFFFGKPAEQATLAPYKVEAPAFKPTADAAPVEAASAAETKPARKPRANVAANKIAAAKKTAAPKAE